VSGQNQVGFGQESVRHFLTPEGVPTGSPFNLTYHFLVSWSPLMEVICAKFVPLCLDT
jgi:hypothetical protein